MKMQWHMAIRWHECWDVVPELYALLKESETLESAREKIISHINALDWTYRRDIDQIKSWDYILLKEAIGCLKNIISQRSERLAGTPTLEHLWTAAITGDSDVTDDFIDEFVHLFKAIKGQLDVYPSGLIKALSCPISRCILDVKWL
jgi:lysine 2,3-aminomutase